MKRISVIGVTVLGVLLLVFAGISHGGGMMHKSSEGTKSMERAGEAPAPEFWTYEYWQASETGTLASHGEGEARSKFDDSSERRTEPIVLEAGPFKYREIDLGG